MLKAVRVDDQACPYATAVHAATQLVAHDFHQLHGGDPAQGPLSTPLLLQSHALSFQAFAMDLHNQVLLRQVQEAADPQQRAFLDGAAAPGARAFMSTFPTTPSTTYPNTVITTNLAIRLLKKNICGFEEGQYCPSGGKRCGNVAAEDAHMMWCASYVPTTTHNLFVREIRHMIRASGPGIRVADSEPTVMPEVRGAMVMAGMISREVAQSTGRIKGGDIWVEGLSGPGAVDVYDATVVVPSSAKALAVLRKKPSASLADVWERAKRAVVTCLPSMPLGRPLPSLPTGCRGW
jgi:hypothetical protein